MGGLVRTDTDGRRTAKSHHSRFGFAWPQSHFSNVAIGSTAVIASVTGTETDPQGYSRQVKTRRIAGVLVAASNAAAARLASGVQSSTPMPITMSTA